MMKLIKPMMLPLFLFVIAASMLLAVHLWANWDNYFPTPEEDDFHPEEPAGELVTESEPNASRKVKRVGMEGYQLDAGSRPTISDQEVYNLPTFQKD